MKVVHELASSLGLGVSPRIVKDSNNTIVRLAPLSLVAKVGTSHFRDASLEALDRELDVARYLASRDAPIVYPSQDVPSRALPCRRPDGDPLAVLRGSRPAGGRSGIRPAPRPRPRGAPRLPRPSSFVHGRARRRWADPPGHGPAQSTSRRRLCLPAWHARGARVRRFEDSVRESSTSREPSLGELAQRTGRAATARLRDRVPRAGRVGPERHGRRSTRRVPSHRLGTAGGSSPNAEPVRRGQVLDRSGAGSRGGRSCGRTSAASPR